MKLLANLIVIFFLYSGVSLAQDFRLIDKINDNPKYDLGFEEPIFVVNGKRTDKKTINQIKPESIAHIEVIKPPQSVLKYGEDGKNGLIIFSLKPQENIKKQD